MTQLPIIAARNVPSDRPAPVRWSGATPAPAPGWVRPGALVAMLRGLRGRCPCCGQGKLFQGWLRQVPACAFCHAPVGAARGDDAPPYFVIFIVAHLVIGTQVMTDAWLDLPVTTEAAIFLPLALGLCMGLLRPVKGATIGLMMQLGLVQPAIVEV